MTLPYPSSRSPVFGANVVATSQPLAAQAGLAMIAAGGNAIDAAVAAAMTLTVVEPTGCGIGSDAFAILWDGSKLHGLNASGRAPAAWTPDYFAGRDRLPERGWNSVTVPGAVSAWILLWRRFGSLSLGELATSAIRYARDGFQVTPKIARLWQSEAERLGAEPGFAEAFLVDGKAPRAGQLFRNPAQAATLAAIVASEGESFYRGELAARMAAHARDNGGAMTADDLAAYQPEWVDPIAAGFAGTQIHEIPPNGQGIVALIGLALLETVGIGHRPVDDAETIHLAIEATKLALVDVAAFVGDPGAMSVAAADLLSPSYIAERARLIDRHRAGDPGHGAPGRGGTVYLATADAGGRMVSFIQSNFVGFGSGVVVPRTGISLQNRGAGFTLRPGHANTVAPGKRPFHTIIPAFATNADGSPLMAFGVMGGQMQAQGHLQMALRTIAYRQNPQAAVDAPRWRVLAGREVAVESSFDPKIVDALRAMGHEIVVDTGDGAVAFGGAQIVMRTADGYVAGSDPRKDGQAVAF